MASQDNACSELSAAIAGIKQLAQDVPGTELISCNGQEARFKLPNPPQGSNGEGALVCYQGRWMTPPKFEELCGIRGKVWRRSFKVYTTFEGNQKGWLRMDMWLRRQHEDITRGQGRVQGGAENRSSSEQESSGDERSSSTRSSDETSESEAQDVPGTELISCNGQEARFKLPNPLQGSNGEGALVCYQGRWMTPPRFEELCGIRGKVWRRSLKVYTTLEGNQKGWLRMDMWLRRQHEDITRGQGRVQSGAENRSSSEQESSGDERSSSTRSTDDMSESETSSHKSGGKAKEASPKQAANLQQSRPTRGGRAAQASGARAEDATPSSAKGAHTVQRKTKGKGGKSARENIATGSGEAGTDAGTPSQDSRGQAENSKSTKRQREEAETPEMKRQRIEQMVKAMAEEQQRAITAAAAAEEAFARACKEQADWEAKQAKLAETEMELQAAKELVQQKCHEQAEQVERLKQEQACQLEEPRHAVVAAEEKMQQAQKQADEAYQRFFAQ